MSELTTTTITVQDGGFVFVQRGDQGRTRLEIATVDRTVALGVILTLDEVATLGLELFRTADRPGPFG